MSARGVSDELVHDDDVRELGTRLADADRSARRDENLRFAEAFVAEHRATFERLAK